MKPRFAKLAPMWGLLVFSAYLLAGLLIEWLLLPPRRQDGASLCAALMIPTFLLLGSGWDLRRQYRILRRQRLAREGRCGGCGYSLAGNLSGVCPECGTAVEPVTTT